MGRGVDRGKERRGGDKEVSVVGERETKGKKGGGAKR